MKSLKKVKREAVGAKLNMETDLSDNGEYEHLTEFGFGGGYDGSKRDDFLIAADFIEFDCDGYGGFSNRYRFNQRRTRNSCGMEALLDFRRARHGCRRVTLLALYRRQDWKDEKSRLMSQDSQSSISSLSSI